MKKFLFTALKILVTFGGFLLLFFMFRGKSAEIVSIITEADLYLFLIGSALYVLATILIAFRLMAVLKMYSIKLPVMAAWKLGFIGYFFNIFMPSSVGGDLGKAYYVYKSSGKKAESFLSVIIDRFIGLFSIISLCAISTCFAYSKFENRLVPLIVLFFFSCSLFTLFVVFNQKALRLVQFLCAKVLPKIIVHKLDVVFLLVHKCRHHKITILKAYCCSVVFQVLSIIAIYIVALAINVELHLINFFVLIPLVYIFSMLPSINGLGVREGAFVYFFGIFIAKEKGFALSLLFDCMLYAESLIGCVCYFFHKNTTVKEIAHLAEELEQSEIELKNDEL